MKKLWNCLAKFHIHFISIIIFVIAFITGKFIPLLLYFFIASIHESFHCIFALFFKLEVKKIEVYPFGLSAKIDSLNKIHPFKAIVLLFAGPLSYFFSLIILKIMFVFNILSLNSYNGALEINRLIFFFNLLPIWPLDGAKIIFYMLSFFVTFKKCYYFVIGLSTITTFILVFLTFNDPQLVIITFLVLSQIEFILTYGFDYYRTLVYRMFKTPNYKLKIHSKNDIYLPYENIKINDIIYEEEKLLIKEILNRKKE